MFAEGGWANASRGAAIQQGGDRRPFPRLGLVVVAIHRLHLLCIRRDFHEQTQGWLPCLLCASTAALSLRTMLMMNPLSVPTDPLSPLSLVTS